MGEEEVGGGGLFADAEEDFVGGCKGAEGGCVGGYFGEDGHCVGELAGGEVGEVDVYYAVARRGEVGESGIAGGEDGWIGGEVVGFVDSYYLLGLGGGDAGGGGGEGGGVG